jgi:hypothetical protein
MELITSWERKGRAEGLREGRAEGLREGLREGQRLVVERILTRRFGALLPLTGVGFWGSPFAPSLVLGFRMPNSPFSPCRRSFQGVGFSGSPCVPSSVSGNRMPTLPLLPL